MQGKFRSRKAAPLALALFALAAFGVSPARAGLDLESQPEVVNQIKLELRIAGLGKDGCEVEIKPAHAACEFDVIKQKVDRRGFLDPTPFLAKSASADHDCTFAIVIREPGKPPRTLRRGIRLDPQVDGASVPKRRLPCYVSAQVASKVIAKAKEETPATRAR
jgi:hypothetical protein